jgi:cell wall-associated NlpC family hydrolase
MGAADDPRRAAVVAEARQWIGTPYHHMGRLKGVGCDCLTLLVEVYLRTGMIAGPVEVPFYRPDVMLHSSVEGYLEGFLQHGHEVETPLPGDTVLFRWGKSYGHGGLVEAWPWIINADPRAGVSRANATQGRLGRPIREPRFISPF